MSWSYLISAGALLVSLLGWIDSRRRLSWVEVAFAVEPPDGEFADRYKLRNVGTRRAWYVDIDATRLTQYELPGSLTTGGLDAGESMPLWIKKNSMGELPDSIRVTFGRGPRRARVVPFPKPGVQSPSGSRG